MENSEAKNKPYLSVYTAVMARRLLKMGYQIYDIRPNRNPKAEPTIFLFKNENGLYEVIGTMISERKKREETKCF